MFFSLVRYYSCDVATFEGVRYLAYSFVMFS